MKPLKLPFLLILIIIPSFAQLISVKLDANHKATVVQGTDPDATAWASFNDTRQSDGWTHLDVETLGNCTQCTPADQAYAAGFAESYLTHQLMLNYWQNYATAEYGPNGPPQKLIDWMQQQYVWINGMVSKNVDDDFWKMMGNLMSQFQGLVDGYKQFGSNMSVIELYMLNSVGDLEDLNGLFSSKNRPQPETDCSGFIKVVGDDIFCGQATWRSFYAMLRVYKIYDFDFYPKISFSSSPGLLHSKDDFYLSSSGLVIMETTNSVFDKSLFDKVVYTSALSWQRVYVANAVARSGSEWCELFEQYNSGTYNNQWMIVDFNVKPTTSGSFWISEQIPGTITSNDMSTHLSDAKYWPSYNIPYFKNIYDASGYPEMKAKLGDEYDYDKCTRAKIFRRNETDVSTIDTFKAMMRYNNYPIDPLSPQPDKAVASRYDLRSPSPAPFGAIDAKVISLSAYNNGEDALVISGPTHANQPVFDFKDWPGVVHTGVPDRWDFDWIQVVPRFG